ncbi:MAG: CCA tRNA nucleotidyltransferase [Chlamydiia bacterium]|nr:CCA tRNA nucleotidyltransferase [Chlamydiia bacterium]
MEEHPQARFIVETLTKAGFIAYYAGGWVRDFLLQHPSDDIDIATNAPPETIQALFPHTVPIGIAFGIILVIHEGRHYEVATFRQDLDYKDGRRPSRIAFATPFEDAQRRDFTINGMFYDPFTGAILDFVQGRADLEKKVIRAIGNPHERIKEDRLRMIRAVRLSCRFNFAIDVATAAAIRAHAGELFPSIAIERICQEFMKGLKLGHLPAMLLQLHEFGILAVVFSSLQRVSLSAIKIRLHPTKEYPKEAPLIAYLLPLFPGASLVEQMDLCKRLKLPAAELQFTEFLFRARGLMDSADLVQWAHFYASHLSAMVLQIIGASLDRSSRILFVEEHEARRAALQRSIARIQTQDPVVKSEDLLAAGIAPGKQMGELLRQAERIAICEHLEESFRVIERLKELGLWPSA